MLELSNEGSVVNLNKFRGLEPLEPGAPPVKPVQMGMAGGYRGDLSPRQLPPNASPELSEIRFERSAIRKEFGWQAIGLAASAVIRAILEHKYIDANQSFHRLIRIFINGGGNAALEVWDGVNWVLTDTSSELVNDVYIDALSALGCAYFADGQQVLEWCEVLEKFDQENDFPSGNSLTIEGEETQATVSPGDAAVLDYQIAYDVEIFSSPDQDTVIEVEFFHGAVSLGTRSYFADQLDTFPVQFLNETFNFTRQINDLDVVKIQVKSAVGGGTTAELDFLTNVAGTLDFEGDKTPQEQPSIDGKYTWNYDIDSVVGSATVGFYVDNGAGFVKIGEVIHSSDEIGASFTGTVPNLTDPGAQFGLNLESGSGNLLEQGVSWTRSNADFEVHGHNKANQGDDPAGVFYQTTGAVVSQFQAIDPGPGGRFLEFFARRLVVLRSHGDTQALTWSADGLLDDFEGEGSGEIVLVEARSDPIDDLMGTAVLSSNFMALFRKRSIMRVFETGAVTPALGAVGWIENLGTNYPFSIQHVRGGAIFLGHDNMVYFLTEQGPTAIGGPIHQDLVETLNANLDLVDSAWDPTFQEYLLGIPVNGASTITRVWTFDVQKFLDEQQLVWRKRPMVVQRFAARGVSEVE